MYLMSSVSLKNTNKYALIFLLFWFFFFSFTFNF